MVRARRTTIRAVAVIVLLCAVVSGPFAWGHAGGRVELSLSDLTADQTGPTTWRLQATVVDADSGAPAAGFEVTAEGKGARGSFGPVTLVDQANLGRYVGEISAAPGDWSVRIRGAQLPGGERAVPMDKTVTLPLSAAQPTERNDGRSTDAPAGDDSPVDLAIERGDEAGANPNWVSVKAQVTDRATGKGVSRGYDVFVMAESLEGDRTEPFTLDSDLLHGPEQRGVFRGFVVVPHGGPWTLIATVNEYRSDDSDEPPVIFTRTTLAVDVAGVHLESANPDTALARELADELEGLSADPLVVGSLWVHTIAAVGWLVVVALFVLLGHPSGRRLLSGRGVSLLDSRLEFTIRGFWWLTGLIVLTGGYQILNSTPYDAPLTAARAREVFDLPYGRDYFVTLAVKLVAYGAMVAVAIPVASRAREMSRKWLPGSAAPRTAVRSPWEVRETVSVGVGPRDKGTAGGAAAGFRSDPGVPSEEFAEGNLSFEPPRPGRLPIFVLGGGALVLTVVVTLLKYFHVLSEAARRL